MVVVVDESFKLGSVLAKVAARKRACLGLAALVGSGAVIACTSPAAQDESSQTATSGESTDEAGASTESSATTLGSTSDEDEGEADDTSTASADESEDSSGPSDLAVEAPPPGLGCLMPSPQGAAMPPQRPAYPGTCPELTPGVNTLPSFGVDREFILVLPSEIDESKPLPLFVMWHWLGADAPGFVDKGFIQEAADTWHFAVAVPESKDDVLFKWPFTALDSDLRIDEELAFYDAMVDCVAQQYTINESCIATGGVSAGALWSAVLASRRGVYLSSVVSLSGGSKGSELTTEALRSWGGSPRKMPFFVLWGGPEDFCIAIDFEKASLALEADLEAEGHFIYECVHNCTHGEPPFDPPMGSTQFFPMWQFMLDHPYWLDHGDSPYLHEGEPEGMPQWCDPGAGFAMIREGECGPNECL